MKWSTHTNHCCLHFCSPESSVFADCKLIVQYKAYLSKKISPLIFFFYCVTFWLKVSLGTKTLAVLRFVGWSLSLVQAEESHVDGGPWNSVQTFTFLWGWSLVTLVISFPIMVPSGFHLSNSDWLTVIFLSKWHFHEPLVHIRVVILNISIKNCSYFSTST